MTWEELLPLVVIVTLAWTVQAITGFGSTVLALTLGAAWIPIPELLPVTVLLNLPLTSWTTLRHRREVSTSVLRGLILPWMGLGFLIGLYLAPQLGGVLLRRGFGVFVLLFAARDLWALRGEAVLPTRPAEPVLRAWVVLAGVIHGVYGSGGPALVQATTRVGLDRGAFRATMSAVWLVFNVLLLGAFGWMGRYDELALTRTAWLLPCVAIGIFAGERLHGVIPEKGFRLLVQVLLVLGGIALLR